MDQAEIMRQYLTDYLEEEFRRYPGVRVRRLPVEPGSETDSENDGVSVKTESREYLFPFEWARPGRFQDVEALVRRIKEVF